MFQDLLFLFGCIPEITKDCIDMTNASSTYVGIAGGAAIGGIISWWVYYRQKKIADIQDLTLNRIKKYDEKHDTILNKIQKIDLQNEETLNKILDLAEKIDALERKKSADSKSD